MHKYRFGELVREVKAKIDRNNNPYEYYIAGDHMDSEDLTIHRRGRFTTDDVGPAFIREFKKGQVLYGSRRTYLKKIAVADFDGVTSNTTFVLETKNEDIMSQALLPFIMLTDRFTSWSIGKSKGSTNPYILFSDLENYEVELPEIEKQRELASILWQIFRLKERYNDVLQKSDELVQSQFIEMFYGKNFPTQTIGSVVDKDIVRVSKKFSLDDKIEYLDISSVDNKSKTVINTTTYMLSTAPSRAQYVLQKGDILYSTVRPNLQNIAMNPYTADNVIGSTGFCVIRCRKVTTGFMWGLVTSEKFTEMMVALSSGANYPAVTDRMVYAYEFPLPPMPLQEQFAAFAEQLDKSKFAAKQALKDLEETQKALMLRYLG